MAAMQAIVNRPSWSIAAQYAPLMYLKSLIGQKDRTQKNDAPIFLRSMFLPSLPVFSKQRLNRSRPKNVPRMNLPRLRVGLGSARRFQNGRVRLLPNQCMPAWLLKANRISLSAFSSAGASPSRSADAFNWCHPPIATMAAMQAIVDRRRGNRLGLVAHRPLRIRLRIRRCSVRPLPPRNPQSDALPIRFINGAKSHLHVRLLHGANHDVPHDASQQRIDHHRRTAHPQPHRNPLHNPRTRHRVTDPRIGPSLHQVRWRRCRQGRRPTIPVHRHRAG